MGHALTQLLLHLSGPLIYTVVGGLAFAEAAVFVGFVLPGETAVVLGGVLASRHAVPLAAIMAVAAVAAIAGDSVGYEVGRKVGPRLLEHRWLARHGSRLDGARGYLAEKGGWAVFAGRWVAFLRAVMPGLAGMSKMHYPRFLAWNAVGGLAWASTFTLIGFVAGTSFETVVRRFGWVAGAVVVTVGASMLLVHRSRSGRRKSGTGPHARSDASGGAA